MMNMKRFLFGTFVSLLAHSAIMAQDAMSSSAERALTGPLVVETPSGKVKGCEQEGSLAFLGIPYAKVERFQPPMAVDRWDTLMICDHWGRRPCRWFMGGN